LSELYANNFYEILHVLSKNHNLKNKIIKLIETRPIAGKVIEEESRKKEFIKILQKLIMGEIPDLNTAYHQVQNKIPRNTSKYADNRRVFTRDWAERLVRIQLSRFYNQAVMEILNDSGEEDCFIPHSQYEDHNTLCTTEMAGKKHKVKPLYNKLIDIYENENYNRYAKTIPQHPNCTHVIRPII